MRRFITLVMMAVTAVSLCHIPLSAQNADDFLQEAKVLMFDKKWTDALTLLEKILDDYPDTEWYSQAVFYKAKCLEEQKGREEESVRHYREYIRYEDANPNLIEDAEMSIILLSLKLYQQGRRSFVREIESRLDSRSRSVRYYAALQLSFVEDKRIAEAAIPVLEEILEEEGDEGLRDRARLALLRIDPDALTGYEETRDEPEEKLINFQVINQRTNSVTFSLSIPWALADLAFSAIPSEEKNLLRKEGYDLDRIVDQLMRIKGSVIEFRQGDHLVKIWIK